MSLYALKYIIGIEIVRIFHISIIREIGNINQHSLSLSACSLNFFKNEAVCPSTGKSIPFNNKVPISSKMY